MENKDLSHKIIGCAMKVHSALGCGFQEVIYQRALGIEMERQGILFARELEMEVTYYDSVVGTRRVDFFVENLFMVELKALALLEPTHVAQAVNYLEAYKRSTGLLINFGAKSLEFKRGYNIRQQEYKK